MKQKDIQVFDNIFPTQLVDYIEQIVLHTSQIPFFYVHNIATNDPSESDTFTPGLNSNVFLQESAVEFNINWNNKIFTENKKYFSLINEILYRAGNYNNIIIEHILMARLFLHLPSPNPGPDPIHVDQDNPHSVLLYYINDSDGDTILYDEDRITEIKRVTPKKGRCILFNGLIPHCSSRPFKSSRAIINFNFLGKKLDKK